MGNATLLQEDFGAGIYRGRRGPANAVYDALNALIDDEGQLFKRGGSVFLSTSNAGVTLQGLAAMDLVGGSRIVSWNGTTFVVLDGSNAPVTTLSGSFAAGVPAWVRPAVMDGIAYFPLGGRALGAYGGALKTSTYSTGTLSLVGGSTTVSGVGTTWTTNIDPGMLIQITSSGLYAVQSVSDDVHLELTAPAPTSLAGSTYTAYSRISPTDNSPPNNRPIGKALPTTGSNYIVALFDRLFEGSGHRVAVGDPGYPNFKDNNYHQLPLGLTIIGMDVLGDLVVVFTTRGAWAIMNGAYDLVDDFGNAQQSVRSLNGLVLWGDPGIARFEDSLVVPAIDDVYLMGRGNVQSMSGGSSDEKIRPLYRSYVKAGYQPGLSGLYRGHYMLPILNGSTLVDVLVCRLDRGAAWTRWSGHAASGAYGGQIGVNSRAPKLLAVSAQRVIDTTGAFDGPAANSQDADGTTPVFQVDTVDFDTGPGIRPNTVEKVRTVYEMAGTTPTVSVSYATGLEGASYSAATLKRGGGASDGSDYTAHRVGKKTERIRFRISCASTVTSLILRRVEVTVRQAAQS